MNSESLPLGRMSSIASWTAGWKASVYEVMSTTTSQFHKEGSFRILIRKSVEDRAHQKKNVTIAKEKLSVMRTFFKTTEIVSDRMQKLGRKRNSMANEIKRKTIDKKRKIATHNNRKQSSIP